MRGVAHMVHGKPLYSHPEYQVWLAMRSRCTNPRATAFRHYGGRGIRVCDRWAGSFELFLDDMGFRPSSVHSIDRIDVNGNYEPSNCRWATAFDQIHNRRPYTKPTRPRRPKLEGDALVAARHRFRRNAKTEAERRALSSMRCAYAVLDLLIDSFGPIDAESFDEFVLPYGFSEAA